MVMDDSAWCRYISIPFCLVCRLWDTSVVSACDRKIAPLMSGMAGRVCSVVDACSVWEESTGSIWIPLEV